MSGLMLSGATSLSSEGVGDIISSGSSGDPLLNLRHDMNSRAVDKILLRNSKIHVLRNV